MNWSARDRRLNDVARAYLRRPSTAPVSMVVASWDAKVGEHALRALACAAQELQVVLASRSRPSSAADVLVSAVLGFEESDVSRLGSRPANSLADGLVWAIDQGLSRGQLYAMSVLGFRLGVRRVIVLSPDVASAQSMNAGLSLTGNARRIENVAWSPGDGSAANACMVRVLQSFLAHRAPTSFR